MKKYFMYLLPTVALLFTACSQNGDDPDPLPGPDEPAQLFDGAYVIDQGSYFLQIEGGLTLIDAQKGTSIPDVFTEANNRSLGNTPQAGVLYGSHVYVAVYGSNTIEILDRNTNKSIKQISLADAEGQEPRSMVADHGKVYISMYNGYVSRLDTTALAIDATVKVGPNPEIMAIHNGYIYVPNSDGLNYQVGYGTTASKIRLSDFTVDKTFEVGLNPQKFLSNGKDLFLMCSGNYYDIESKVYRVVDDRCVEVAPATLIACDDERLYMINAPYGVSEVSYKALNLSTGEIKPFITADLPDAPTAIGVSPANGDIYVASNVIDGGFASYTLPGYVKLYGHDGSYLKRFDAGVYPSQIFFETPVE